MKRPSLVPLLAALPASIGLAAWLAFRLDWLPGPVIYLRAGLGTLMLIAGLMLTLLCGAGWAVHRTMARRFRGREAETRAREAATHRRFLRRLDHELKGPLTAMQIEVANLETAGGPWAEAPPALQRLKGQVARMNDLAVRLRKLGELEGHPIESEPIRLDELLADLVDELQSGEEATRREITLSLPRIPWPLPEITGDADLVYLALRNVLGNAVKFTRPGDAIQVRAFEDASQVIVEIADQGPGIAEDELPLVWEELYRGLPGSGLGLPIVRAIVERHGGQVALRSRPDQGTVVTIRLPARS